MKYIASLLLVMICTAILAGCSSKDYKNQPWMPSKLKSKSQHGHHSKKAHDYHREYDVF